MEQIFRIVFNRLQQRKDVILSTLVVLEGEELRFCNEGFA